MDRPMIANNILFHYYFFNDKFVSKSVLCCAGALQLCLLWPLQPQFEETIGESSAARNSFRLLILFVNLTAVTWQAVASLHHRIWCHPNWPGRDFSWKYSWHSQTCNSCQQNLWKQNSNPLPSTFCTPHRHSVGWMILQASQKKDFCSTCTSSLYL